MRCTYSTKLGGYHYVRLSLMD